MNFIDTHCHIHDPEFTQKYDISVNQIIINAASAGVSQFICVGTDATSSQKAIAFAKTHDGAFASLAIHPHEVANVTDEFIDGKFKLVEQLAREKHKKVVAIGECGLDYFYHESEFVQNSQKRLFKMHLDLAIECDLPLIFHIRSAFDDFFAILDEYAAAGHKIRGVVHSFSTGMTELQGCLDRDLFLGLNGIMTFTKDESQLAAARAVPLTKMLLETDAPFLTPKPYRGKMCQLKHVVVTGQFLSELRNEPLEAIANATTTNAKSLFSL